jgi:hypothetical protein
MPHARMSGTAWDRNRKDYAYTRELEGTGWAWEFLRRNADYRDDFRSSKTDDVVVIKHPSGTTLYKLQTPQATAENWGLALFADPAKTALVQDLIWLPEVTTLATTCALCPAGDRATDTICLECFKGRTAVLLNETAEVVTVRSVGKSVTLNIVSGSILAGHKAVTFSHDGFKSLARHIACLRILQQLMAKTSNTNTMQLGNESKYLAYLIALDGHLEGRSYRDIAEVLYGPDRVGTHWIDDTRWMKSKVRRAVERGIALMNSGYHDLL